MKEKNGFEYKKKNFKRTCWLLLSYATGWSIMTLSESRWASTWKKKKKLCKYKRICVNKKKKTVMNEFRQTAVNYVSKTWALSDPACLPGDTIICH